MPHRFCLRLPELVWLHALSDGAIALAYFLIPLALIWLVRKRRDLAIPWLFVLFALFILGCGGTHVLGIVTLWVPVYRLDGLVKAFTAAASLLTAGLLIRFLPWLSALPGPDQWRHAHETLEAEILERKRAEAKYVGLLESAPDAVVVMDQDGKMIRVNTELEKLFGYQRSELLGAPVDTLIPERFRDQQPMQRPGYLASPRPGGSSAGLELYARHKNGSEFPVEISLGPLETEEGLLVSAAIRDITSRRTAEQQIVTLNQQLREAAEGAEAANRAKSVFLSTMSHEIRTPMNAILGYAQLMLRDPSLPAAAKENLEIIGRSGEHLLGLINDVLDLSKVEAGRTELRLATFHLPKLLAGLAALFRQRAQAKALVFEMSMDLETSYIVADEGKLRQIFINLVGNAIKFTMAGQVTLRVSFETRAHEQLWLVALVEDTGPGLTPEEQGTLFQPFTRMERWLNTTEGTGLGLVISRKYAAVMGGEISLTSEPGRGSTFRLEIPVERADSVTTAGSAPKIRRLKVGTEAPLILVVDDQFENRDWLVKYLATLGFSVLSGENGKDAIRIWEESKPELILMDVHMPVMDGLEATRRIKATPQGQKTAIVILSASALDGDRRKVSDCGADDFLTKPCVENELLAKIASILKVSYEHEDSSEFSGTGARDLEGLGQLPTAQVDELHHAVANGS